MYFITKYDQYVRHAHVYGKTVRKSSLEPESLRVWNSVRNSRSSSTTTTFDQMMACASASLIFVWEKRKVKYFYREIGLNGRFPTRI